MRLSWRAAAPLPAAASPLAPTPIAALARHTRGHRLLLLKLALGAVTVALGFAGFVEVFRPDRPTEWIDCLFRTLQLLFAQFPGSLTVNGKEVTDYPWTLNVARFTTPAVFLWVGASALIDRARQPLGLAGVGLMRGHTLVVGGGEAAAAALRRLKAQRRRVVLAGADPASPAAVLAVREGLPLAAGDPARDPSLWRAVGVGRAAAALVAMEDDGAAVGAALALAAAAAETRDAEAAPLRVVAVVADPALRRLLDAGFRGAEPLPGVSLDPRSPAEAQARSLLQRQPLHRGLDAAAGEPLRAVVCGFGALGEALALLLLRTGMTAEAAPPQITVVDRHAEALGRALHRRHDQAPPLRALRFADAELEGSDAEALDAAVAPGGWAEGANAVFITLDDDARSLLLAVGLRAAQGRAGLPTPPVCCRQRGGADLSLALRAAQPPGVDLTRITGFGRWDDAAVDALLGEALDRRAQLIHADYLERFPPAPGQAPSPAQRPWARLGELYRQSSRDQADYTPLRLASLSLAEIAGPAPDLQLPPEALERAARAEHSRWCASVQLLGWRAGETRDNTRLIHPDIVSYDVLSEATKDKDRAVLKDLSRVLCKDGAAFAPLTAVPCPQPEAAETPASLAARWRAAVDAAGGAPVALGGLADARETLALAALHAAAPAVPVRLRLQGTAAARVEALPAGPARAAARRLLEDADQVLQQAEAQP